MRAVLRPVNNVCEPRTGRGLAQAHSPRCAWWDHVWSVRTGLKVGPDGRVPISTQRLRIERPPAAKIVLCLHLTGHHSVLAAPPPNAKEKPALLFTNRPN